MSDLGTLTKSTVEAETELHESVVIGKRKPVSGVSVGDYLVNRLLDHGVEDIFGIPGDYVLSLYSKIEDSPIHLIGCTREDSAGFAADAYARIKGLGAACVTYAVGGFSIFNSIAGAYAEKSPVVVISGSPGRDEQRLHPLLHHRVRNFRTQEEMFRHICIASAVLDDADRAWQEIDRVLEAVVQYRRPGYIEIPRDMVNVIPEGVYHPMKTKLISDTDTLNEAVFEAARRLSEAENPCILAGVEIQRYGLQNKLIQMAEKMNIPVATTLLGKSVVAESHPLFAGVYEGAMGYEPITRFVEESDLVLVLGAFVSDLNLGIYTSKLEPSYCVYANGEMLQIGHHWFEGVLLSDFIDRLGDAGDFHFEPRSMPSTPLAEPYSIQPDQPITVTPG